jgi:hypothetical protein
METTMPLLSPTTEDQRKLHAEITQIANQRFLIALFAITTFGVVEGWILPKLPTTPGAEIGGFVFAISIVLCLLVFGLFMLNYALAQMQRVFTAYLIVTDASKWEQDWKRFRSESGSYWGYTRPFTFWVFVFLVVIITGLPFLWPDVYEVQLRPIAGAIALLLSGGSSLS